jgi:hypothetical protein
LTFELGSDPAGLTLSADVDGRFDDQFVTWGQTRRV